MTFGGSSASWPASSGSSDRVDKIGIGGTFTILVVNVPLVPRQPAASFP